MRMNTAHHELLSRELSMARGLIRDLKYENAFRHLQRAHVLGQAYVRWHIVSHWLMLKVALRRGEVTAALGQAIRMVLGSLGSLIGRVPVGNTGGSDVSMFRRMPIPTDLLEVMARGGATPAISATRSPRDDDRTKPRSP